MKNQSSHPHFLHHRSSSGMIRTNQHIINFSNIDVTNSRSNSVLRLKKNSNFKITLAKPKQDSETHAAPSIVDFKRMLKTQKGFAPKIRYSHINSNELLELISQPGRVISGTGQRPNQINTFRPFEEAPVENFNGYYTKRTLGKSRESSPRPKISPRNSMYQTKFPAVSAADSLFNINNAPSPIAAAADKQQQQSQTKILKLRKNGFVPDWKNELFNHFDKPKFDKDVVEEPRGRLKPYKVSDKFYLDSFVLKDYANKSTQELLGTWRSPQSGADSMLLRESVEPPNSTRNKLNQSPQKFLSRRTASISNLRSLTATKLEVDSIQQQPIQITDRKELLEAYKTRQSFNARQKLVKPVVNAKTERLEKFEKRGNSSASPENSITKSPKSPARTLSRLDQSPRLKGEQGYNDTRYALKTLRTLRSLGGGLGGDIDNRSPSPFKNKSTLNGFQVSTIEDNESHFHNESRNQ